MEEEVLKIMNQIDQMGGSVVAVESGWMQEEIARSSYLYQQAIEDQSQIIVGVNKFQTKETESAPSFKIDDSIRTVQSEKLKQLRAERDNQKVEKSLLNLEEACVNGSNVMPHILEAVENYATLGEIADTMRKIFGEFGNA
jgi:methylmalonyl-CoA mutase N-terminal domain/subunit